MPHISQALLQALTQAALAAVEVGDTLASRADAFLSKCRLLMSSPDALALVSVKPDGTLDTSKCPTVDKLAVTAAKRLIAAVELGCDWKAAGKAGPKESPAFRGPGLIAAPEGINRPVLLTMTEVKAHAVEGQPRYTVACIPMPTADEAKADEVKADEAKADEAPAEQPAQ